MGGEVKKEGMKRSGDGESEWRERRSLRSKRWLGYPRAEEWDRSRVRGRSRDAKGSWEKREDRLML